MRQNVAVSGCDDLPPDDTAGPGHPRDMAERALLTLVGLTLVAFLVVVLVLPHLPA